MKEKKIGFIGMGFIGGNLAKNFEERGFTDLVCYSKEPAYVDNETQIKSCEVVFIAVPTPTIAGEFDDGILDDVLGLVSADAIAVVKSTVLPTTLAALQSKYSCTIMHSPEFLSVNTAKYDTDNPERNIIGVANPEDEELLAKARQVQLMLPEAPYNKICSYEESALIKYGGNCFFFVKNVFFNLLHDMAGEYGADWNTVHEAIIRDSRIHEVHTKVNDKGGRGAGGYCLPKDFFAFINMYRALSVDDFAGMFFLGAAQARNLKLLTRTGKDPNIVKEVYGEDEYTATCPESEC